MREIYVYRSIWKCDADGSRPRTATVTAVKTMIAALVVDRCDVDEDLSPLFHHCVPPPPLPPGSGRRSRRGVAGVAVVSVGGPRR